MARPIKILHVFSTFAVGGPQRRFADLAHNLEGYEHVIAACDGRYDAENLLTIDAEYTICDFDLVKTRLVAMSNIRKTRALIKEHQPDLLCTYNFGTMEIVMANASLGKSKVSHIHFEDGFGPEESQTVQLKRRVTLRRMFLKKTPIVVPSHTLKSVAIDVWTLPPENIQHIDNGVDLDLYPLREASPKEGRLVIGTVGAFRAEKNLIHLIDVFAASGLSKTCELLMVGDGPEMDGLVAHAKKMGVADSVTFAGHQTNPQQFYQQFDIFALTSDTEQMPLSILEAMATGLPIVATSVGDVPQMVASENAPYLHSCGDIEGLAGSLHHLTENAALRLVLGQLNRAAAEKKYNRKYMLTAYDALFRGRTEFT